MDARTARIWSYCKLFELLIPACFLIYFDDLRTQMAMLFFSLLASGRMDMVPSLFGPGWYQVGPGWTFIQKQYPNLVNLPYPAKNVCLDLWKAYILPTGWWFQPTPLKNDGVFVSWDDDIPNI